MAGGGSGSQLVDACTLEQRMLLAQWHWCWARSVLFRTTKLKNPWIVEVAINVGTALPDREGFHKLIDDVIEPVLKKAALLADALPWSLRVGEPRRVEIVTGLTLPSNPFFSTLQKQLLFCVDDVSVTCVLEVTYYVQEGIPSSERSDEAPQWIKDAFYSLSGNGIQVVAFSKVKWVMTS